MQERWLDIMRQAGDGHIGQTLTRLATLAAAAHQHAVANDVAVADRDESERKVPYRLEGPDRLAVVQQLRSATRRAVASAVSADAPQRHGCLADDDGAEPAHKEVSR